MRNFDELQLELLKDKLKKRLREAKVREPEIDIRINPSWCAYHRGQIRAYEIALNDLTSVIRTDYSNSSTEIFEPNGETAFLNGLHKRLGRYDLEK